MAVTQLASVDGRISPTAEAVLPLPDDGLYRGDGVFEVARLYGGKPFAMRVACMFAAYESDLTQLRITVG
jgi:hypothetical protein